MIRNYGSAFFLLFFRFFLGQTYHFRPNLLNTNSPSYYFTKRSNHLNFVRPLSIEDGAILFVEPVKSSLSNTLIHLRREHAKCQRAGFQRVAPGATDTAIADIALTTMTTPRAITVSIYRLFGNPWWIPKKKNSSFQSYKQPSVLRKKKDQNDAGQMVLDQNDRLKDSGLRAETSSALMMDGQNKDKLERYSVIDQLLSIDSNPIDLEIEFGARKKRVHTISLLRHAQLLYGNKHDGSARAYDSAKAGAAAGTELHSLSILRGYNARHAALPYHTAARLPRDKKSLHNLSLLRGYYLNSATSRYGRFGSELLLPADDKATAAGGTIEDSSASGSENAEKYGSSGADVSTSTNSESNERMRLKAKRVHNLSLLRYDGKLFQNVFPPNDAEFQQKRFQQKRYPYYQLKK